jgi:hypothetical protein
MRNKERNHADESAKAHGAAENNPRKNPPLGHCKNLIRRAIRQMNSRTISCKKQQVSPIANACIQKQ